MSLSVADQQITLNFKKYEFACQCGCGFDDIDYRLVEKLQLVRDELGHPLKITSGCRCAKHNEKEGGNPFSAHLAGFAVDISCTYSSHRMTLLPLLCKNFRRVGIQKYFIHVDIDPTKGQDVIWTY